MSDAPDSDVAHVSNIPQTQLPVMTEASPADTWLVTLNARALSCAGEVLGSLLNNSGYKTGDARDFHRKSRQSRRFAIALDATDGSWTNSYMAQVTARGVGLVSLIGLICETGPDRSA